MLQRTSTERPSLHVLIAEDHTEFRRLLAETFRAHSYEVTECCHGVDLIARLQCLVEPTLPNEFDLIISDIRMPGVTGLSVLAGLQEFPNAPPVILITAFGDVETHEEARRLGAAAVLDKPFDLDELLRKASEVLRATSDHDTPLAASTRAV